MIRHALAPVLPSAAGSLGLPRTLPEAGLADGATAVGVALTFDDGPHPDGTPAILELLSRARARATFFMIGEQVQRRPRLAAEVLAGGHVVALHGYRHRLQLRMSVTEVGRDLERGLAAIADATGAMPTLHRPPYGIYSAAGLSHTRSLGLRPLLWSRWGKDWRKFASPHRIARRAAAGVHGGEVILLHDADFYSSAGSHERTARALAMILRELDDRGIGTVLPV